MGINNFADKTFEEYSSKYTLNETMISKLAELLKDFMTTPTKTIKRIEMNESLPMSFDWRDRGAVTKARDQYECGSCYAIDCYYSRNKYHTWGCTGGMPYRVYDYVKDNNGISKASDYPNESKDGECHLQREKFPIYMIGYGIIDTNSEETLEQAQINYGPIVVALDGGHESFQRYSSGIYYDKTCSSMVTTHSVLLVEYGSDNGNDYWILKNSFGNYWGDSGFFKLSRNCGSHCGIIRMPLFPILK
ncbi:CLUMA_CG013649, isoform A [Clunio marinus]|uniref:CLUMA_CG013649, isoform A n=1 Tax=Clunio marinus TaxID=568069 RepID=A0A1J1IJG0_9DIPT|nr:CLUMA_CG013649, isoform A [Clunio marinus]